MDGFELNKIAGAVLTAALLIFGGRTLVDIIDHPKPPKKAAFALPQPKGGAPGAAAPAAAAAFDPKTVVAMIGKASAESGKEVFRKCVSCHTIEKGGRQGTGPNLWGVVGNDLAKVPGFAYSPALQARGGKWTYEALVTYMHDPRRAIPNNKMAFPGIKDEAELADLIAYMRTQADSPVPLPN